MFCAILKKNGSTANDLIAADPLIFYFCRNVLSAAAGIRDQFSRPSICSFCLSAVA